MRFRFGSDLPPTRKLFISRRNHPRRRIVNIEEIETVLRRCGFEVVAPETLSFRDQVRLFASAKVVVGEAGAAMANIGFCPPSASIVEIQSSAFGDNWIKAHAALFGHRWHVFQGIDIPKGHALFPPGGDAQFATSIDAAALEGALDEVCGGTKP